MANSNPGQQLIIDTVGLVPAPLPAIQVLHVVTVATGSAAKVTIVDSTGVTIRRALTGSNETSFNNYSDYPVRLKPPIVCTVANNCVLYIHYVIGT